MTRLVAVVRRVRLALRALEALLSEIEAAALEVTREPEWRVYERAEAGPCVRCGRPDDGAVCSDCATELAASREARA